MYNVIKCIYFTFSIVAIYVFGVRVDNVAYEDI